MDSPATAPRADDRQPVLFDTGSLIVFSLTDRRFGVEVSRVERVIRAVEITPVPNAPAVVLGVIHDQDEVVPVMDVRRRFALATRPVSPDDQLLIARSRGRRVALLVDSVEGIIAPPLIDSSALTDDLTRSDVVSGVVRLSDGLLLIHDVDAFLSRDEEERLDQAMRDGDV